MPAIKPAIFPLYQKQIQIIPGLLMWLLIAANLCAQPGTVSFQKLTVQQGLNDGMVNAMTQDERGYMWFASMGGLNRFDGKNVMRFTHQPGDSNSLRNASPYAMAAGSNHTIWVGYIDGLQAFDSRSRQCRNITAVGKRNIYDIIPLDENRLAILSRGELLFYDIQKDKLVPLLNNADGKASPLVDKPVYNVYLHGNELLLGKNDGIASVNIITGASKWWGLPAGSGAIGQVGTDAAGSIWALNIANNRVWCINRKSGRYLSYDWLLQQPGETRLAELSVLAATGKDEIWIGTRERGLLSYNIFTQQVTRYRHDPERPHSVSGDFIRLLYQVPDGTIWLHTMQGTDYFQPGSSIFKQIQPYASSTDPLLGRGVSEDHHGNLWLTSLRGLSCFNPRTGTYKTWRNETGKPKSIYSNSVRASAEDEMGRIWIATANGVNRLTPTSGKMEFLTEADGLPIGFYFAITCDRQGRLWIGTRDNDGFYYYDPNDKKVHSIARHPALNRFTGFGGRHILEDSKGRLWLGFNGSGMAMYDPQTETTRHWTYEDRLADTSLVNNLVLDIKEDKRGVIWVTSFGGICGIDIGQNKVMHFTNQNGLKSNMAGPLAVDAANRLWVGTAAGLLLIDSTRKKLQYFSEENGLPVVEMPEHPACYTANGDIVMPAINGFIRFNPMEYREVNKLIPCHISGITLFSRKDSAAVVPADHEPVKLQAQDNFFAIGLEAINFLAPSQTMYRYKLEGFDKEWRYTKDPQAVYTNVPGGQYRFLYMASANNNNWPLQPAELLLDIGTVFYKTVWFWVLVALLGLGMAYAWYQRKMQRQRQWLLLENKSNVLEKEKAQVMYESLKQQLNPHFLFNSLTSLGGLIETDQQLAGNFLSRMSKIYRYILKSSEHELVTVKDDLAMMKVYVSLQQTRFEQGLELHVNVPESDLQKKIPPVTLQNLVENAIKHNIIDADTPLIICIESNNGYLQIRNNLQKKKKVETSNKQGLKSLVTLYRYLSEKPVIIEETTEDFIIQLPLIS